MPENITDNKDAPLRLVVLTRSGCAADVRCSSVRLVAADNADGHGGGSLGIRKGCCKTVVLLAPGDISASLGGENVLSIYVPGGFATVTDNTVTVLSSGEIK